MKTIDSVLAERDEARGQIERLANALRWATAMAVTSSRVGTAFESWQCRFCFSGATTREDVLHAEGCPVRVLAEEAVI